MEQLIIENSAVIIAALSALLGWALARLKDYIDLKVKASENKWDDAIWEVVKAKTPATKK